MLRVQKEDPIMGNVAVKDKSIACITSPIVCKKCGMRFSVANAGARTCPYHSMMQSPNSYKFGRTNTVDVNSYIGICKNGCGSHKASTMGCKHNWRIVMLPWVRHRMRRNVEQSMFNFDADSAWMNEL